MTSALRKLKPFDPVDLESRADDVRSAVGSARLEGLEITQATQDVFDDYASGSIDADEVVERVLGMYGPGA